MKHIIHLYGAAGSGTSTLGKALADRLGYRFMDTDDYLWLPTNPRFTTMREPAERIRLIKADFAEADNAVISGSLSGWGDELIPYFTFVIRIVTPTDVRLERIKAREYGRFGDRIREGGDMHDGHVAFLKWAEAYDDGGRNMRSRAMHDEWQKKLTAKQITVDGTKPICDLVSIAVAEMIENE